MEEVYNELLNAIREKCQRDRWYGPECLGPRPYDRVLGIEPNFDRQTLETFDPHDPSNFGFVFPPANEAELVATEVQLDFALPPLLCTLYAQLANGGFGPQGGIRGALHGYPGPYPNHNGTIVGYYPGKPPFGGKSSLIELHTLENVVLVSYGQWPRGLLQICDAGCCIEMCLGPDSRMYRVAPSENDDFYWFRRTQWTLEEWLWGWIRGEKDI